MKVEEWQKRTRFLGEEKRYNAVCRLNEVAYATHPAHSMVDFVQHLGVVSFLRETVFINCSCSVHQILFHMIWETISTTEQHNHSSGMLKQFVAQPQLWNA